MCEENGHRLKCGQSIAAIDFHRELSWFIWHDSSESQAGCEAVVEQIERNGVVGYRPKIESTRPSLSEGKDDRFTQSRHNC